MAKIAKLGEVNCVAEYICLIKNLYDGKLNFPMIESHRYLFFRGQCDATWTLKPSLFREGNDCERDILLDIKQFSPILNLKYDFIIDLPQVLIDLQHAGVPTRVLDWTVEPLTALFFAAKGFDCKCNYGKVWVLNPWEYNKFLRYKTAHVQSHDINILARAMLAYGWKIDEIKKILKEQFNYDTRVIKEFTRPMAFVGVFTNDRKNAQHGCFTIFGEKKEAFEEFCKNGELAYFVVNNQKEILSDLNKLYINDFSLFPDFYGVKEQIRKYKSLFKF